ncbi:hypothetical protein [Pseudomonas sp. C5pp]|uniref:hypothetical protein n=1 Tax=Pseudomonas sp. C5pp TaxID=1586081 RepID=UPI00057EE281|nr:hypothetical protein [Pseudomonas sp. C5pp]KIC83932.1 hypothetical protein RR51_03735 [Pseudomonas sp. C5pp]
MYRLLVKIPILGVVIKIMNSYAYDGDFAADSRFAGIWAWIKAYFSGVLVSALLAALLTPSIPNFFLPYCMSLDYTVATSPGDLATSILPNLLGFGIGVYALVFALDRSLVKGLQETFQTSEKSSIPGSALLLNAEMALPLIMLIAAIVTGVAQKTFPTEVWLVAGSWFAFWLSMYFILGLVNSLFMMGDAHLSQRLKDE